MINFAHRNLKLFFRTKSTVFFSLLSVFITIGLYTLFLGDVLTSSVNPDLTGVKALMDSWIVAGTVSVTTITTTLGAFAIMVEDKERKMSKDFYSSPIKRSSILGGYVLSAFVVGIIMSIVAFILGEAYIVLSGGEMLSFLAILKVLGIIILGTLMSSALIFFVMSFVENINTYSIICTVFGTLVGFLTGIYLPIGQLPDAIQTVVKFFPVSHTAALMRQTLMEQPLATTFSSVPIEYVESFQETMGVTYTYGDSIAGTNVHLIFIAVTTLIFLVLSLAIIKMKKSK